MGNFENNIGKFILDIEDQITKTWRKRYDIDWGHECDCEHCDLEGDDADPEADKKAAKIDKEIEELKDMQRRLQAHANLHGVPVFKAKKKGQDESNRAPDKETDPPKQSD